MIKLLAYAIGHNLTPPVDEPGAGKIEDYNSSIVKVPLSKYADPLVSYSLFSETIYPSAEEKAEWDDQLATKIKKEREKNFQDEKLKKQVSERKRVSLDEVEKYIRATTKLTLLSIRLAHFTRLPPAPLKNSPRFARRSTKKKWKLPNPRPLRR